MAENAKSDTGDFASQESADNLLVDPRSRLSERKLREIMRTGDKFEMNKNEEVFLFRGKRAWTVRPGYWRVAIATDDEGNRFLTESDLDRVLPRWRQILNGERFKKERYPEPAQVFREWLDSERHKADRFGKSWPKPSPAVAASLSPEPVAAGPSRPHSHGQAGHAPASSSESGHLHEVEETRLLRQALAEAEDLKDMVARAFGGNMVHPMAPAPQVTNVGLSLERVRGPDYHGMPGQVDHLEVQYPTEVQPLSGADWLTVPEDTVPLSYFPNQINQC